MSKEGLLAVLGLVLSYSDNFVFGGYEVSSDRNSEGFISKESSYQDKNIYFLKKPFCTQLSKKRFFYPFHGNYLSRNQARIKDF